MDGAETRCSLTENNCLGEETPNLQVSSEKTMLD